MYLIREAYGKSVVSRKSSSSRGKKMVSLPNSSGRKTDIPKDFFSNHEYKSTTELTC